MNLLLYSATGALSIHERHAETAPHEIYCPVYRHGVDEQCDPRKHEFVGTRKYVLTEIDPDFAFYEERA